MKENIGGGSVDVVERMEAAAAASCIVEDAEDVVKDEGDWLLGGRPDVVCCLQRKFME